MKYEVKNMNYMDALAKNWREHDYSFEGRDVLPNGDEVWIYTTLELGLPVLWVKHPDGSFDLPCSPYSRL